MPSETVTEDVQLDTTYRVYKNGRQTDQLRFIARNGTTAYAVRWEYDEPQPINLDQFLTQHTLIPRNGVPTEHERRPNPDTHWKRY